MRVVILLMQLAMSLPKFDSFLLVTCSRLAMGLYTGEPPDPQSALKIRPDASFMSHFLDTETPGTKGFLPFWPQEPVSEALITPLSLAEAQRRGEAAGDVTLPGEVGRNG